MTTRRAFLGTLAGGLLAAPLAVEGQQAGKVWRIGLLDSSTPDPARQALWNVFRQRVADRNYRFDFRSIRILCVRNRADANDPKQVEGAKWVPVSGRSITGRPRSVRPPGASALGTARSDLGEHGLLLRVWRSAGLAHYSIAVGRDARYAPTLRPKAGHWAVEGQMGRGRVQVVISGSGD